VQLYIQYTTVRVQGRMDGWMDGWREMVGTAGQQEKRERDVDVDVDVYRYV